MTNRTLTDLKKQWLLLLLLCAGFAGLQGQCMEVPVFETLTLVERGCNQSAAASLTALTAPESRCFSVNAATGAVVSSTLSAELKTALIAGGGIPTATSACGGSVEICVADEQEASLDCAAESRLVRTYTARNLAPEASQTTVSTSQIVAFLRPELSALEGMPNAIFVTPDDGNGRPENPAPRQQDYPFFAVANGNIHLTANSCNFTITFQDGARNAGCGNNFTFVRTFQVLDGCGEQDNRVFTQVVRVGDQQNHLITPPLSVQYPLQFSTTNDCGSVFDTRLTGLSISDICDGSSSLNAYIYLDGDLAGTPVGPYAVFGPNPQPFTDPIPVGQHIIRYLGQDSYGAETSLDIDFQVVDNSPPNIVCVPAFTVALGAGGEATLAASSLDGGSSDNCGAVTLTAAFAGNGGQQVGNFGRLVTFNCGMTGPTAVLLEATDETGVNRSRCLVSVLVVDQIAPTCVAPPATELTCRAFADNLPTDIVRLFNNDPEGTNQLLDDNFGRPTISDNCDSLALRMTLLGNLSACGTGRLVRRFVVSDEAGFTQSGLCQQIIDVRSYVEYSLRFPGDQNYTCAELPTPEDLVISDAGCDLIAVTTMADTLDNDGSACLQLRLVHEVINWCEYDGISAMFDIPRDADNDGNLLPTTYLNIDAANDGTLDDDRAVLDRDAINGNGNEIRLLIADYAASGRRGAFRYEQYVSITDNDPPTVNIPAPDNGQTITEDCLGGIILAFTATDDCIVPETTISLDVDVADRNNDGQFNGVDFVADRTVNPNRFTGEPATGVEVFIRLLPIGRHLARVRTADGCGNQDEQFVVLNIKDGKAPTPDCRQVNTVGLVPDVDFGGIATVFATDFIQGPPAICTEAEITYAIFPETEAGRPGFIPLANQVSLSYDCSDLGEQLLRIYAFSEATGLHDFCNISLTISAADPSLCEGRQGTITGVIMTEAGEPMQNVEVFLSGRTEIATTSEIDGSYFFDGLQEERDYTVRPFYNDAPINGLSTFDISELSRYLLGEDIGLTPYQFIAADANNNGAITILDLLEIREVLLGIEDNFDNNTSWRFVPADYVFPEPNNPWAEEFPTAAVFAPLSGNLEADFIAIKVGDINGSATPSGNFRSSGNSSSGRNLKEATVELVRNELIPGQYQLQLPDGTTTLQGLQLSMHLPEGAVVSPGIVPEDAFVVDRNGVLRLSYVAEALSGITKNTPLIRLSIPGEALPYLLMGDRLLQEGYDNQGSVYQLSLLQIATAEAPPSARVFPNPVSDRASLSFHWEKFEVIQLSIIDGTGREVFRTGLSAATGQNMANLTAANFSGRAGVYFVRLSGHEKQETVRVVVR
ncbi:T9SS type A sorting domain-containing protein [Neolewinella persica]|uniref:T9SS type A sorting domain-containing protein n=1 Tax=Neolewinella persica TaxID=70998 RepID=UPI0003707190|nr:T9SS type A sorting domain-containing protein [Neolewinella persica]